MISAWRAASRPTRPRVTLSRAAYAAASSSSRVPLPFLAPHANVWEPTFLPYTGKGKARWYEPVTTTPLLSATVAPHSAFTRPERRFTAERLSPTLGAVRHFHASSRRDALPLIPALAGLLKGTTLLTLTTGISRVLFSFFPFGTLATLRLAKGVQWLAKEKRKPYASEHAEEFWKMWCEGENGIRVTKQQAADLVHAPETPDDGLLAPDGRVAYSVPLPKHWRRRREKPGEDEETAYKKWVRSTQSEIHKTSFFLPPLPPASERSFHELSLREQEEVHALRHYYASLRLFKKQLWKARLIVAALVGLPVFLLLGVWASGLERVPFTGRWRLILLTPEEEDTISSSLEGANWFKSVLTLLTTEEKPAPPVLPLTDWRWQWVQSTLRHLEAEVIAAVERIESGAPDRPPGQEGLYPPPSEYPLRPRPRVSARLHAALPGEKRDSGQEHFELGPPYNIMLMEAPDKNAFSYGFGGKGAGGIVIFTGLLDDILSHGAPPTQPPPPPLSIWESIFGPTRRPTPVPQPTDEQTLFLATVIAHEMGHLLLSHHLETLSHQQVLWPSILGLSVDLLRAFIWPFTVFLGPAVNDALANVGRTSTEEMTKRYGHIGFENQHEFEADITGLRLLAHAGFDPRAAVDQFAGNIASLDEIATREDDGKWWDLFKLWWYSSHPSPEERITAMSEELERWGRYDEEKAQRDLEREDDRRKQRGGVGAA